MQTICTPDPEIENRKEALQITIDLAIADGALWFLVCRITYADFFSAIVGPVILGDDPVLFSWVPTDALLKTYMDRCRAKGYGEIIAYPMTGKTRAVLMYEIMK